MTIYDNPHMDHFYRTFWGDHDTHVGLYEGRLCVEEAMAETVDTLFSLFKRNCKVLDLGSGYGGPARWLARRWDARVTCVNVSLLQNERNRALNKAEGLDHLIRVHDGSYQDLNGVLDSEEKFDRVVSLDAFLHSPDRDELFRGIANRLLASGKLIFTDIVLAEKGDVRAEPLRQRLELTSFGSIEEYRYLAGKHLGCALTFVNMTHHAIVHYSLLRARLLSASQAGQGGLPPDVVKVIAEGMDGWVSAFSNGILKWGFFETFR